ncbi:MAG: hypothetical protein CM15mV57_690 [uncultured marine virus]|nr:MAG: hypothetical protein CM15mV57_690 [uncultured marine virus]
MQNATIELPADLTVSLLKFIQDNMQVKGKEGAKALLTIVEAFEKAIGKTDLEVVTDEDF